MNNNLLEKYYKEKSKEFNEITESIDYSKIDFNVISHDELKEIILRGVYIDSVYDYLSNYIDKCKIMDKTVEQTMNELLELGDITDRIKEESQPLTYESLKESTYDIHDDSFKDQLLNYIEIQEKAGSDIGYTFEKWKLMIEAYLEVGENTVCKKCGKELDKIYIDYNKNCYCEECSEGQIIIMTAKNK